MLKIDWLTSKLSQDYPDFSFQPADHDRWSPQEKTIFFNPHQPHYEAYLFHELAHGILDHNAYKKDIELIAIERDAWELAASELAPRYEITIDDEIIQHSLDTYRDWLHAKSACPRCDQTGIQLTSTAYKCLYCRDQWRVNQGIHTEIRRYL